MRHHILQHFKAQEFLPPDIYRKMGDAGLIVMDSRILWTMDALREHYGKPININTWFGGGQFTQRGFRTDETGSTYSQHRFGRACDFDIAGVSAYEFRGHARSGILARALMYVTRIEDDINWCHIDCASIPGTEIVFFKP